jgi:O-antigen/teichoic acid export membrane protein
MPIAKLFYQSIIWKGLFFLSAFILNVLIARHYQASVSGQIFYLINLYAFIILIVSLSLESAMGYYISKNEIPITKLINFCFIWTVLIAIVIFLFMALKKNTNYTRVDMLAITFICGNLLSNYCTGISYAKRNFFLPNVINISINLSLIFLILLLEFLPTKIINDDVFLIIFFSSFLLQGLASLVALGVTYLNSWRLTFPTIIEFKKIFHFGLIAFSANIISFLLYRVDYWFVKEYCNAADLGNYIQVSKLAQVFFILPGILAGAVFPLTAGGQRQYVNDILATISRLIFMLYFFCCAILSITGYWLFPFLFGNSFKNMYLPFLFLIPGILALSTLYTLTAYYAGKNKMSVNITGASIALAFIIAADVFFIPKYGINAAAIISSIGYIIYHIYVLGIFTKEYDSPAISFFNFKLSDIQKIKRSIFNKVS